MEVLEPSRTQVQVNFIGGHFFKPNTIVNFFNFFEKNFYRDNEKIMFVLSAPVEMTDLLIEITEETDFRGEKVYSLLDKFLEYHQSLISDLFSDSKLSIKEKAIKEIGKIYDDLHFFVEDADSSPLNHGHRYANILQSGEIAISKIVSAYLESRGVKDSCFDARVCVKTGYECKNSEIENIMNFQNFFSKSEIIVTQSSIGKDWEEGNTIVESGHITAAKFALSFDPDEYRVSLIYWNEIGGIFKKDGKLAAFFSKALYFLEDNYTNKFIHPKAIETLRNSESVYVKIRSFEDLQNLGTLLMQD